MTSDLPLVVIAGLDPQASRSVLQACRDMPAATAFLVPLARQKDGIDVAGAHSLVMPGLGPGIHEFAKDCARRRGDAEGEAHAAFSATPRDQLVDAKPKAWHDDVGWHRLQSEPDTRGLVDRRVKPGDDNRVVWRL